MIFEFTIVGKVEATDEDEAEFLLRTTIEAIANEVSIEDLYEADDI
jgi:hypothetical protein